MKYQNKEGVCPKCKGDNLSYGVIEVQDDYMLYYPYKCEDCGQQGEEWYSMKFAGHNVITEDGEIIELEEEK